MSIKQESLLIRAKILDREQALKALDHRANNYIIIIRSSIDANAYDEDFTELQLDRAKAAMDDFHKIWNEAINIKAQIEKLKRELNG